MYVLPASKTCAPYKTLPNRLHAVMRPAVAEQTVLMIAHLIKENLFLTAPLARALKLLYSGDTGL